jgi:hypothetical protein
VIETTPELTPVPEGRRRRWPAALAVVGSLVAVGLLSAPACEPSDGAELPPSVRVDSARALADTYATAPGGTTIVLAPGVYAPRQLKRTGAALTAPIVLRPAPDAVVEVQNLDVAGPSLHIEDLHLTGIIRFRAAAVGSRLEGSTVDPGNVIVEGDDVAVVGNRLRGPPDRDALDIGATDGSGPAGVVVRGNTIGPGTLTPGSSAHVDCLQVMSGTELVIADNLLYDCPAQTLLIKSDLGPVEQVRVARNSLRGCTPRTDACPAYMTLQVVPGDHPMRDITVVGNSIAGAFRGVGGIEGVVLDANAIDRIEDGCQYVGQDNVIGSSRCELPAGNHLAAPQWVDPTAEPPDLHAGPGSPTVDAGPPTMEADASGRAQACGTTWDAGAYERCEP